MGSPVDFSFMELATVSALSVDPNPPNHPIKCDSDGKFFTTTLRLNNNSIPDLTGLMDTLSSLFVEPTGLTWLDLSFNQLQDIDPVLTQLKELRLLYLHGNSICKLAEVDKLAQLPLLHTITLHGNPIAKEQGYRSHLIVTLPHLKSIDFSAVTKQERELTSVWQKGGNPRKYKDHSK